MSQLGSRAAWLACYCFLTTICAAAAPVRSAEPLFCGAFADGTVLTGARLQDWHGNGAQPSLNGRPLFDGQNPLRWLRLETAEVPAPVAAFVELYGGDRLPGRVSEYQSGRASVERAGAHVLVSAEMPVDFPGQSPRHSLRVRASALRRVVWRRRGPDRYAPGTLFFADGREVRFRSIRWSPDAVTVLLAEGPKRVPFADIAELHLPRRDTWDAYYENLAMLTPSCDSSLMQVETASGLVATTSLSRFRAQSRGGDQQNWYHLVQPAWSLDPFWLPHVSIVWRRFWRPHEVPLSIVAPERVVERSMLGRGWPWQVNASLRGEPLESGGKRFGWGFGTLAYCEMAFALPPAARSFRTRVGLDEAAGSGGCARGAVYLNDAGSQPLFRTNHLIGSREVVDSGALSLTESAGRQQTLVLVSDPAHVDRPSGADPFDIRDDVDWLEPTLELYLDRLRAEVRSRLTRAIPAWEDWTVSQDPPVTLLLSDRWEGLDPQSGRFQHDVIGRGAPVRLLREVDLSPRQAYLAIDVGRQAGQGASRLQVRVNHATAAEFTVLEDRVDRSHDVRLVPLKKFQGAKVKLEVVHVPHDENSFLDWRLLDFQEHLTPTPWRTLDVSECQSAGGAKFENQKDGSLLVKEANPPVDEYMLTALTNLTGITAIRLDVLADRRLPDQGPGRGPNGAFILSDFTVRASPSSAPDQAEPVELSSAVADYSNPEFPASSVNEHDPKFKGWSASSQGGQSHVAVFMTHEDVGFGNGTRLTFFLKHQGGWHHNLGRFRLSATSAPRPVHAERPGIVLPIITPGRLVVFDEQTDFIEYLKDGGGTIVPETADCYSGNYCLRVRGDQKMQAWLPELAAKIRERPEIGEYRYVRFAWKKLEGRPICLKIAHDGKFGGEGPKQFRYHAGPGGEVLGGSLEVGAELPQQWTVVTRDLFADFGEFVFTGLSFAPGDEKVSLFDHVILGRSVRDLDELNADK